MALSPVVELDPLQLQKLKLLLGAVGAHKALASAMSKTLQQARTVVKRMVADQLKIRSAKAMEAIQTRQSGAVGVLAVKHRPLAGIEYGGSASKTAGVGVKFTKAREKLAFAHAFKAKMKSGHVGYYFRERVGERAMPSPLTRQQWATVRAGMGNYGLLLAAFGKALSRKGNWHRFGPRVFAGRLPIQEIYGPSVRSRMESGGKLTEVGQIAVSVMRERYMENVRSQIDRQLKRKKADRPTLPAI